MIVAGGVLCARAVIFHMLLEHLAKGLLRNQTRAKFWSGNCAITRSCIQASPSNTSSGSRGSWHPAGSFTCSIQTGIDSRGPSGRWSFPRLIRMHQSPDEREIQPGRTAISLNSSRWPVPGLAQGLQDCSDRRRLHHENSAAAALRR